MESIKVSAAVSVGLGTVLLLSACGQFQEVSESLEELGEAVESSADEATDEIASGQGDSDAASEEGSAETHAEAEERELGITGHQAGVDHTVEAVRLSPQEDGSLVVEADMRFTNTTSSDRPVALNYELRWPDGEDTYTVPGQGSFADTGGMVPAEASNSGQVEMIIDPGQVAGFDADHAVLLIGTSGRSAAQIALGPSGETVTRVPVEIPDLEGVEQQLQEEDVDDLVTITYAEIRWGGPDLSPLDNGRAHLYLEYTVQNEGDHQTCSSRGNGGWTLTQPNGDSVLDEGVSERCVSGGDTQTEIQTGFTIDAELAGDYVVVHERTRGGSATGQWEFTVAEFDGAPTEDDDDETDTGEESD
ncbi:hypothetical protein [Nesterenkonia muleiensis]|uniref:hypothetical protein n=1 Tax=Nesterenkonia muleiensis TaxID=2282648 RepID=UPI000E7472EC|nr:hypothetical protein [Nesterenkonia muleiensis]